MNRYNTQRFRGCVLDLHSTFPNFLNGIGALRKLIYRANETGALIEGVVAYAALVDGLLRMGLILRRQLTNNGANMDLSLISQTSSKEYLPERAIFKMALHERVIEQGLFNEITELYDKRNAIVHRFLLTPQTYDQIPPILDLYEILFNKLEAVVSSLEEEQIQKGIGITKGSVECPNERLVREDVMKKLLPSKAG